MVVVPAATNRPPPPLPRPLVFSCLIIFLNGVELWSLGDTVLYACTDVDIGGRASGPFMAGTTLTLYIHLIPRNTDCRSVNADWGPVPLTAVSEKDKFLKKDKFLQSLVMLHRWFRLSYPTPFFRPVHSRLMS